MKTPAEMSNEELADKIGLKFIEPNRDYYIEAAARLRHSPATQSAGTPERSSDAATIVVGEIRGLIEAYIRSINPVLHQHLSITPATELATKALHAALTAALAESGRST